MSGDERAEPRVFATDEQSAVPVDVLAMGALASQVLESEGIRGDCELALCFVDEDSIAELNRRFLDGDGPTDVLAFPIDPLPIDGLPSSDAFPSDGVPEGGTPIAGHRPGGSGSGGPLGPGRSGNGSMNPQPPRLLGDVMICPAVAVRTVAERRNGRPEGPAGVAQVGDEVALLVVHGILHILGMDHAEAEEAAKMQARERELLARFHRPTEA